MTDGRSRVRPARHLRARAILSTVVVGGALLVASPTQAEPDVDTVQSRVDGLYREAEQASERFNDARIEVTRARSRLASLRADLDRQQARVDAVRAQVAATVVADQQGQALSATAQVLLSKDPDAFLSQLGTVAEYHDQQTQLMADFALQAERLELREAAARREVQQIDRTRDRLAAERAEIDEKAAEAEALLGRLEERAEQRAEARAEARASRSAERAATPAPQETASAPASGRAGAAVAYAMAQVGKSYVWGAAGPSSFDCSGLTMAAWAQAGVSLPHSSSAQMSSGTPVSQSELQPGDLVFYYSPVSHVGMYIGNGQVVNALNPSSGIQVSPVSSMPYAGAVRPG